MKLRYGDPPAKDQCKNNGELRPPTTLELNMDHEGQQRESGLVDLIESGVELTPWARVRYAVRTLEKKGGNQMATIPGLGTLVVGKEGWEVL